MLGECTIRSTGICGSIGTAVRPTRQTNTDPDAHEHVDWPGRHHPFPVDDPPSRPSMRSHWWLFVVFLVTSNSCRPGAEAFDPARLDGRWVLEGESAPMAMEVSGAGTDQLAGSIVGAVGGRLQPFLEPEIREGRLLFRVAREFDSGATVGSNTVAWIDGDRLVGETVRDDREGKRVWAARRPDKVSDNEDGGWIEGSPVTLFDGSDLSEWHTERPGQVSGWIVDGGVIRNVGTASDLISNREFWNFLLHAEYQVSEGGNSGIGLRGRYEVQIHDDFGTETSVHGNGAVYSRIKPTLLASEPHTEWQTLDIRLVGRTVTVALNATTIIDRQEIEGLTAMARDARETLPGPILLQGDHGPIEFRRVVVTPLARSSDPVK